MKNTLAENMLRFAPKNLGAKDIKTLKRLAEQGAVAPTPDFISLQHVAKFGTGGALLDPGTTIKFLTAPFNNNNQWYWMENNGRSVAQPIGGMRLVATPALTIKNGKLGTRGPVNTLETKPAGIFITDLIYTGAAKSGELDKWATAQTGNWRAVLPTVKQTLYNIGDCLTAAGITRLTNTDVIAAAANLIIMMNNTGTTTFSDYNQQFPELTKAIKKKETDPTTLVLTRPV